MEATRDIHGFTGKLRGTHKAFEGSTGVASFVYENSAGELGNYRRTEAVLFRNLNRLTESGREAGKTALLGYLESMQERLETVQPVFAAFDVVLNQ